MRTTIAAIAAAGAIAALTAAPTVANATAHGPKCGVVHDHITKTDNGHGTPSEWADLSLNRTTTVCGDKVTLVDRGTLTTRPGAGTPNGTGGQIANRVPGVVRGVYHLTVTGGTLAHEHGDTAASSTEYVKSLFSDGATVTAGTYAWTYTTRCEHWIDSSANDDGQGAAAGNITGKLCPRKPRPTPTATDTSPAPTPTSSAPTSSTPPGEAPAPTPVPSDLPVTG